MLATFISVHSLFLFPFPAVPPDDRLPVNEPATMSLFRHWVGHNLICSLRAGSDVLLPNCHISVFVRNGVTP